MKNFIITFLLLSINTTFFAQVADYNTTGYHVQKYDSFLENFSKYNEPCFKSNTFKISVTLNKMRIEIDDSSSNSGNTSFDSEIKDILIGQDLPLDSGAQIHKSITGTMKKLIVNDAYLNTGVSKYSIIKFTGRFYAHKFNFDDFIADKAENADVFFCFVYENGEKENMYCHLSQKTSQQLESDNLKQKMQNDIADIQNQKAKQLKEQQNIQAEQERLRKAQKAEKDLNDVNNLMNQLINLNKK